MAALSGLRHQRYRPGEGPQETKGGAYIYSGYPSDFHEWEFRTLMRASTVIPKDEEDDVTYARTQMINKVVEGLRGDAFQVAKDIGMESLQGPDGVKTLVAAVRKVVFPLAHEEAKELFEQGQKFGGVLARQFGESMVQYISRRRRWWKTLKELDPSIQLSEGLRTSMLLDLSGINRQERLMILTSCSNELAFDKIADALVLQHPRIHSRDQRPEGSKPKGGGKGYGGYKGGKGKQRYAHLADEDYEHDDDEADPAVPEKDGEDGEMPAGFVMNAEVVDEYLDDEIEAKQLDAYTSILNEYGHDIEDGVAELVQQECAPCLAHFAFRSKGKGKGKRKGKGKFPVRSSQLPIDARKQRLSELKAKTNCTTCGKMGHWSGDKECAKSSSSRTSSTPHATLAIVDDYCSDCFVGDVSALEEEVSEAWVATAKSDSSARPRSSAASASSEGGGAGTAPSRGKGSGAKGSSASRRSATEPEEHYVGSEDDFDMRSAGFEYVGDPLRADERPPGYDVRFTIGQHKGLTYGEILFEHTAYYLWGAAQPRPSVTLDAWLQWVAMYYEVDPITQVITPLGLEAPPRPRAVPTGSSRNPASRRTPTTPGPRCDACTNFTLRGSSANFVKRTCIDCGFTTTERREQIATHRPEECPHDSVDFRGSSKDCHRTFCKQCLTVIDEMPQAEWQKRKDTADGIRSANTNQAAAASRILEEVELDAEMVKAVIATFSRMTRNLTRSDRSTTSTDLVSTLQDAIYMVYEETLEAQALMAITSIDHLPAALDGGLPYVDIYEDPGIWAVFDEGCNSACHSKAWADDAEKKLEKIGMQPVWIHQRPRSYTGIGKQNTSGNKAFPVGIGLADGSPTYLRIESNECPEGRHALLLSKAAQKRMGLVKDTTNDTFLVKHKGVQMPVARAMGSGLTVVNISSMLDVVPQSLWCKFKVFWIDQTDAEDYPDSDNSMDHEWQRIAFPATSNVAVKKEPARVRLNAPVRSTEASSPTELEPPSREASPTSPPVEENLPSSSSMPNLPSSERAASSRVPDEGDALMAEATEVKSEVKTEESDLDKMLKDAYSKEVVVISMGFETFEDSEFSSQACHDVQKYIKKHFRGKSREFDIRMPEHAAVLDRSMRKNYEGLFEDREVLYIDCRGITDPADNAKITRHPGYHPVTLTKHVAHPACKGLMAQMVPYLGSLISKHTKYGPRRPDDTSRKRLAIVDICKTGRHRAPAQNYLTTYIVEKAGIEYYPLHLSNDGVHWSNTCEGRCDRCSHKSQEDKDMAKVACEKAQEMWLKALERDYVEMDVEPAPKAPDRPPRKKKGTKQNKMDVDPEDAPMPDAQEAEQTTVQLPDGSEETVTVPIPPKAKPEKREEKRKRQLMERLEELNQVNGAALFTVIERLSLVFTPGTTLLQHLAIHQSPANTVYRLATDNNLGDDQLEAILQSVETEASAAKDSASSRQQHPKNVTLIPDDAPKKPHVIPDDAPNKPRVNLTPKWGAMPGAAKRVHSREADPIPAKRRASGTPVAVPAEERPGARLRSRARSPPSKSIRAVCRTLDSDARICRMRGSDKEADWTGKYEIDFEPADVTDRALDKIFSDREGNRTSNSTRNFIHWLGPDSGGDNRGGPARVRLNCKYAPLDTIVKYPLEMKDHVKTVLVKKTNELEWEIVDDRVPIANVRNFQPTDNIEKAVIFASHSRMSVDNVAYVAATPNPIDDKSSTMTKSQRKTVQRGCQQVRDEDAVMWSCLGSTVPKMIAAMSILVISTWCYFQHPNVTIVDPGVNGDRMMSDEWLANLNETLQRTDPDVILCMIDYDNNTVEEPQCPAFWNLLSECVDQQSLVLYLDRKWTARWNDSRKKNLSYLGRPCVFNCVDDLSFFSSSGMGVREIFDWATSKDGWTTHNFIDAQYDPFLPTLLDISRQVHEDRCARVTLAAEIQEEETLAKGSLDAVETAEDEKTIDIDAAIEREERVLDEMPLPGMPKDEKERRTAWLRLPIRARAAIRRLHRRFGHMPTNSLVQLLRHARAPNDYIEAARRYRCGPCVESAPKAQTEKVAKPKSYVFNYEIGVDALEVSDANDTKYTLLNVVCMGSTFQQVYLVREGGGTPTSSSCIQALVSGWVGWAGWFKKLVCDRGTHNRGVFMSTLCANGVEIRQAGLEAPEQIGRVERHGGIFKNMLKRVVKDRNVVGKDELTLAIAMTVAAKNEMLRRGGFSPAQWVLGRNPRSPGAQGDEDEFADLGTIQAQVDGTSAFGVSAAYRASARRAFVHEDTSKRVQKAILHKSAPLPGDYQVGDLVSYRREQRGGETGTQWSVASRIIGTEDDKTLWVLCEGLPVCVAKDRLRPVTGPEALAYMYLSKDHRQLTDGNDAAEMAPNQQQAFLDARNASASSSAVRPEAAVPAENDTEVDRSLLVVPESGIPLMPEPLPPLSPEPDSDADIPGLVRSDPGDKNDEDDDISDLDVEIDQDQVRAIADDEEASRKQFLLDDVPRSVRRRLHEHHGHGTTSEESRAVADSSTGPIQSPLLGSLLRAGTEGPGVDLLARRDAFVGFMADRMPTEGVKDFRRKQKHNTNRYHGLPQNTTRSKRGGRNLVYSKCDATTQHGLDESRRVEWEKWQKFNAAVVAEGAMLQELLDSGLKPLPTQWIETDKNEHKRRVGGPYVPQALKSRLVGCGNFEDTDGVRTDSPTCDLEGQNLLFSWAASSHLHLCSADITNAYFQGKQLDRAILFRQPPGGLPGVSLDAMLVARVPVYGTKDAGRGFWLKLEAVVVGSHDNFRQNRILPAFFQLEVDGDLKALLCSHVDDLVWACKPDYQYAIDIVLEAFDVGRTEKNKFRYCGKDIEQDTRTFDVTVTCVDNTEKIQPIQYDHGRKLTAPVLDHELSQLRSVVGSLSWIARQCRPDISYRVSRLQSRMKEATVKDLKDCNQVLEYAQQNSSIGLFFSGSGPNWADSILVTITDASFANEEQHKSQKGVLHLLVDRVILTEPTARFHLISFGSTLIKRVCHATLQSESYAMSGGVDRGARLRAIIADAHGRLDMRQWEQSSAKFMLQLWLTDCMSLEEHLTKETLSKIDDKRLAIELSALRQLIWERDGVPMDHIDETSGDIVRWCDTSTMLADCLTKVMKADRLLDAMRSGVLDLTPTAESILRKERQRKTSTTSP